MQSLRKVLRRDVLTACLVIFTADIVSGILSPTFSLYAKELGASLTMIGALSTISGLTQLLLAMPVGLLSDRIGRKAVLALGMVCFGISMALFALAPNAYFLIPGRIVSGVAMVSTFLIGAAYIGDIVIPEERGLALGLYTTSMGLGFAVGPLVGAAIAVQYNIAASYLAAAVLAIAGAGIATWGLRTVRLPQRASSPQSARLAQVDVRQVIRNHSLVAGSLANFLIQLTFSGAIINFFSVYVIQLRAPQAAINSMFSARAFGSTLARLPTGAITNRISSRLVMVTALILAMVVVFGMAQTNQLPILGLLLVLEGISFGIFLTAGQVFLAEHSSPTTRGMAFGTYSTAGSLGSSLSPIVLGLVADLWGVQTVFRLTGALLLVGLLTIGYLYAGKNPVLLVARLITSEHK